MDDANLFEYAEEKNLTPDELDYLNSQKDLKHKMHKQWLHDLEVVKDRRVVPDWVGEPRPLSKDRAALLEYLYENGCIYFPHSAICRKDLMERVRVAKLMGYVERDDGSIAVANAKAVIDDCKKQGLIEMREYQGRMVYQLSAEGEFALEDWQLERELGFL